MGRFDKAHTHLEDRVVILTAVIRYSDYNGCNTLQTYKNSLLFIQS